MIRMVEDPVVIQAISNVRQRYSPQEWAALAPHEVTAQIYLELRRLDLQRVEPRTVSPEDARRVA